MTCAALLRAAPAQAGNTISAPVVVILAEQDNGDTGKLLLRIQGELVADGFRVEHIPNGPSLACRERVRDRCTQGSLTAGLFIENHAEDIEMLFCDPTSQREAIRRVHTTAPPDGDPPEAVARHTVDLLRGGLLDFASEAPHTGAVQRTERRVPASLPSTSERGVHEARWALEGGAGLLLGFGGLNAAITPFVRLRLAHSPRLQMRVTGAALGTMPTVETAQGSATVAQALGIADAAFTLAPATWLRPLVGVGAGVYAAKVSGTGRAPYGSKTSEGAAFAIDGAIGIAPRITPSLSIAVETHVVYAVPAMAVRFVDTDAAQLGPPILFVSLSVAGWI